MVPLNYSNLKAHVTQYIGHNKKYDAIVKEVLPQKEHTSSNTTDFIRRAVKGSGTIRKIIGRRHTRADIHNPKRWRKKLDSPEVTRQQIKESITRLHSKYLDSHLADHLSRLQLGKTHLNAQLHHSNKKEDPYCSLCKEEDGLEVQEDYKHALYSCPNSQAIITTITQSLFPNTNDNNKFNISDILLTNTSYKDPLYSSPEGKDFINWVWDIYQTVIITNHTNQKRPTPLKTLKKIAMEAKDITINLPNSKLSIFIKENPRIVTLMQKR